MKKQLIALFAGLMSLAGMGQTISNPIEITIGDNNHYTLTADPEAYTYYRYAASPDHDELVTITMEKKFLYVTTYEYVNGMKSTWHDSWQAYGLPTSSIYKFVIPKGQEYLLEFSCDLNGSEQGGEVKSFNVEVEPRDFDLGLSPEKPVELSADPVMMTLGFDGDTSDLLANYATYTVQNDCFLEIKTDYIPRSMYVADSWEGPWTLVEEDLLSGRPHTWRMEAEGGKTYCFRIYGSMPSLVWTYEAQHTIGQDPATPFEGLLGQNLLPKEAGTYYYKLQAPFIDSSEPDNFIEIKSDVLLPGGFVSNAADNNGFNEVFTHEVLRLRTEVLSRQFCIITVYKPVATENDEMFEIKFARPEPYDEFYTAPNILSGFQQQTPEFPGVYYYAMTAPNKEGQILNISMGDYEPKSGVHMRLFRRDLGSYNSLLEGETEIRLVNVWGGYTYIVEIRTTDADFSIPFTASIYEAPHGDTSADPIDVEAGDSNAPAGPQKFFRYTAQGAGWVYVRPQDGITDPIAWYEREDGVLKRHYVYPEGGNVYRMKCLPGVRLVFSFMDIPEGASFNISERGFEEGETMDQAISFTESFDLPVLPGNYWFKYEVTEPVKITISTDLLAEFGEGGMEGARAAYIVYLNDEDNYLIPDWSVLTSEYTSVSLVADPGDVVYIETLTIHPENHFTMNFIAEDIEEGQSPSKPIDIVNTGSGNTVEFSLPYISYGDYTWYRIHLYQGILQMEGDDSFTLNVYHPSDLQNYLGRSGFLDYNDETDTFIYGMIEGHDWYPAAEIPEEGDYLFKVIMADPCNVTLFGSALGYSSVDAVNGPLSGVRAGRGFISLTGIEGMVTVCDIEGRVIFSQECSDNAMVNVPAGFYIVKANGKSCKVAVK